MTAPREARAQKGVPAQDRGKEPASVSWFSVCKGKQINDYYLTVA